MYYGFENGHVYGFDEKSDRDEWVSSYIQERYSVTHGVARKIATDKDQGRVYDYYDGSVIKQW